MGMSRHQRRVTLAARRCGVQDEQGKLNDWDALWLKRTRLEAERAGHGLDDINNWTMRGILVGREEVRDARSLACGD